MITTRSASRRRLLLSGAALLAAGLAAPSAGAADHGEADVAALEARAAGVRAIREIKRLQHAWAHYAEAGRWEAMAGLVARRGVVEAPPDTITGREAVHAWLRDTLGGGAEGLPPDRLEVRLLLSPVVTLGADGRTAKGRWHELALRGRHGESAEWSGGVHENDYVLEDGLWRIAHLRYHPQFAGPYEGGWRAVSDNVPLTPYHYTPDGAGTPLPPGLPTRPAEGSLDARLRALDAEADILLAAGAAQNLQAAYGFYTDRKMWDDVADLFAPDGVFVRGGETFRGREAIRAGLGEAGLREGELNDHAQLVPVVTVSSNGRSARVRGIELAMTGRHGGESFWEVSITSAQVARQGDVWMIEALAVTPRMRCDYAKGWAADLPAAAGDAAYPTARGPEPDIAAALARRPRRRGGRPADAAEIRRKLDAALAHDGAENVSCAYGYYIDEFAWDECADLFSVDGWKELSYVGTYIGRERIRGSLFARYVRSGRSGSSFQLHQKTQPYVTPAPDGSRANIRLRLFQISAAPAAAPSYIAGIYENQVIVEDGIFKIAGMDLDYVWTAGYAGGWAGVAAGTNRRYAPQSGAMASFPPDGPLRGVAYAPYPEIAPSGFHFVNPVSGRKPEVFLPWSDGRRA